MPSPFYNAIYGTTAGAPGTGSFTPNAAATGGRAWSNVPSGWIGLVRYVDGSSWELRYGYWNGTVITRPANGFFDSSSGSGLSLTSAATAEMAIDANELQADVAGTPYLGHHAVINSTNFTNYRVSAAPTTVGTGAVATIATTNLLTEQPRQITTSATTANAQSGYSSAANCVLSTTAGRGGGMYLCRWGPTQIPASPKLWVGVTSATYFSASEPSSIVAHSMGFAKDSTDTNIQFLTNSNSGGGTKFADTGIALAANGWYESSVWMEPGGGRAYGLLIRLDTGDIWHGSTTTDIPGSAAVFMQCMGALSATTGTAFVMAMSSMIWRGGT